MLKMHSSIKNFTVFGDVAFEFSPGLNVIVGENGTGKTHVLKLGYLFSQGMAGFDRQAAGGESERAQLTWARGWLACFK
jgi:recombinational DNA repair ATPase RecF